MTQYELDRGGRTRGGGDDGDTGDGECVEQTCVRVGLRFRRSIRRQWGMEIAKARWGDNAKSAAQQGQGDVHALVEPAAGAVHDQYGRPLAGECKFDRPARGECDLAAGRNSLTRPLDIAAVPDAGQNRKAGGDSAGDDRYATCAHRCHPMSTGTSTLNMSLSFDISKISFVVSVGMSSGASMLRMAGWEP
jgi:hypothetical protein